MTNNSQYHGGSHDRKNHHVKDFFTNNSGYHGVVTIENLHVKGVTMLNFLYPQPTNNKLCFEMGYQNNKNTL